MSGLRTRSEATTSLCHLVKQMRLSYQKARSQRRKHWPSYVSRLARGVCDVTLCPAKRNARNCGLKFQTISVASVELDTSCFMLGLKATEVTGPLWPRNVRSN